MIFYVSYLTLSVALTFRPT